MPFALPNRQSVSDGSLPQPPVARRPLGRHYWLRLLVCPLIGVAAGCSPPQPSEHWHIELPKTAFGPLEVLASTQATGAETLLLRSSSAALEQLRRLPGAQGPKVDLDAGSWAFELTNTGPQFVGESLASRVGDHMALTFGAAALSGAIDKGWFAGDLRGERIAVPAEAPLRDYRGVAERLASTMREQLYDSALFDAPAVQSYLAGIRAVAAVAHDDVDMMLAGRWAWDEQRPFSHFELRRSQRTAAELIAHFDTMDVPGEPVVLERRGAAAVLRVRTLMGQNTRTLLREAMADVIASPPDALLIDLRGNPGGAFAVVDLIEPLIAQPQTVGAFYGRNATIRPLSAEALDALPTWSGDSLSEFWSSLAEQGVVKIAARATGTRYEGPLAVLVDATTASAAELASQALRDSCRGILVGERTAGQMLTGSYFDLGEGFQVYLPVGDYFTAGGLRIEGRGVDPDVAIEAAAAEEAALRLLQSGEARSMLTARCTVDASP